MVMTLNLSFDIPDDRVDDVVDTLRYMFGPVDEGDGVTRPMTPAEAQERFKSYVIAYLRRQYRKMEAERNNATLVDIPSS